MYLLNKTPVIEPEEVTDRSEQIAEDMVEQETQELEERSDEEMIDEIEVDEVGEVIEAHGATPAILEYAKKMYGFQPNTKFKGSPRQQVRATLESTSDEEMRTINTLFFFVWFTLLLFVFPLPALIGVFLWAVYSLIVHTQRVLRQSTHLKAVAADVKRRKPTGKSTAKAYKTYDYQETLRQMKALAKYHNDLIKYFRKGDMSLHKKEVWTKHAETLGYHLVEGPSVARVIKYYKQSASAVQPTKMTNDQAGFTPTNLESLLKTYFTGFCKDVVEVAAWLDDLKKKAEQERKKKQNPDTYRERLKQWRQVRRETKELGRIVRKTIGVCHGRLFTLTRHLQRRLAALETEL